MFRLWCLLIGYVCGLIPTAYIVGKVKGIDIREHGSGNAGTTNALRVMGKRAGGIVLAGDMMKCFLGIVITYFVFRNFYPEQIYLIRIYTAFGIILGHDYPFFLHFKGGKGIACFGGMVLSFYVPVIPACIITFFGTFFLTHLVSLSSIMLLFTFLAEAIIFGQAGFLKMSQANLYELYGIIFILVILALFQHRKNIVRLIKGEERRTYLKKKTEENISASLKKKKPENAVKEKKKTDTDKNAGALDAYEEEEERKPRIKEVIDPKKPKKAPAAKKLKEEMENALTEEEMSVDSELSADTLREERDADDLELEEIMESIKESKAKSPKEQMDYIELDEIAEFADNNESTSGLAEADGREKEAEKDKADPETEKMEIPEFLKKEKKKTGKKRK